MFLHLQIPFVYEPQLYKLPSGGYIVDFWLPDQNCFFEVKPKPIIDMRHKELAQETGKRVIVAAGDIPTAYDLRKPAYAKGGVWDCWLPSGALTKGWSIGYSLTTGELVIANTGIVRDDKRLLEAYTYAREYHFPKAKGVKGRA